MKLILLLLLAATQITMQEPHNPFPDDPKAYCMAGPPMAGDTHGHECHCKMICVPHVDDPALPAERREDPDCPFYCAHSEHCLCHTDQSCDEPMIEAPPR